MEYNFLDPNEMVILSDENVRSENLKKTGNLMLTNRNIIFFTVGTFKGKIKNIYKRPLSQIKVFQNQPQAKVFSKGLMEYALDIYFISGNERYVFINRMGKKRILEWVKAISATLKGEEIITDSIQNGGILGVDVVAGTIKETFNTISSTFKPSANQEISGKCSACGAPLSGKKNQIVQCPYCDTKQKL